MPNRLQLRGVISRRLNQHQATFGAIPGIATTARHNCFIEQLIESIHRVEYARLMASRSLSSSRADPSNDELFNPLLAAIYNKQRGDIEEAYWLIFIFTHFGKGRGDSWRFSREFYGKLGQGGRWDWRSVRSNPHMIQPWIDANIEELKRPGSTFGNHRKYESWSSTGRTIESYVDWLGTTKSHHDKIGNCLFESKGDPRETFERLYRSMSAVFRFGRTAKFDYLTMINKIGLETIEAPLIYISEATGPRTGSHMLYGNPNISNVDLEQRIGQLSASLNVDLQVMEDAICNWQKSPDTFKAYRI